MLFSHLMQVMQGVVVSGVRFTQGVSTEAENKVSLETGLDPKSSVLETRLSNFSLPTVKFQGKQV